MRDYFFTLAGWLEEQLRGAELFTLAVNAEHSDFVRFNHNRVRQAGSVSQCALTLDLIEGRRHGSARVELTGNVEADRDGLRMLVGRLREQRAHLPEDPYLNLPGKTNDSDTRLAGQALPPAEQAVVRLMESAGGLDLVGVWASGTLDSGFANSLGQRNWHSSTSFNLDWSCHYRADKAIKTNYSGFDWSDAELQARLAEARQHLSLMQRPPKTIETGRYRVYLAPSALQELLSLLAWGGFSLKSRRTEQTPLILMANEGKRLSAKVTLIEAHSRGLVAPFTENGFRKPDRVTLIENGEYRDCLASPRSAAEYGVEVNAGEELPESLDMAPGDMAEAQVLSALDTGLYVNNLWYTNFSDRRSCRITGMTRFGCFWVDRGAVRCPVNVMRFDDSLYRILGDCLLGLTGERELMFDSSTYGGRSRSSYRLPGALVDGLEFTL